MEKINCVRINNFSIKPVITDTTERTWKGKDVFPKREFFNIALLSKTGSGKTTVIYNLIKKFRDRHTIVMVFASTIAIDKTYEEIFKYLDKKGNQYLKRPHFKVKSENLIDDWLKEYSKLYDDEFESDDEDEKDDNPEQTMPQSISHICGTPMPAYNPEATPEEEPETQEEKEKKERKMNFIIVLDDLSQDLRDQSIETLLKKARHYRARVIISSQSLKDIRPNSHSQLYALCLFNGLSKEDIKYLHSRYPLNGLTLPKFERIYYSIVNEKPYNFLTIIPSEPEFRVNLDEKLILDP